MHRAESLATFICRLSKNSGSLNLLYPYGPVKGCFTFTFAGSGYRTHLTGVAGGICYVDSKMELPF